MQAISNVILAIHVVIAITLVATVLLQKSEGGGLGMGSRGGDGIMSTRGQANLLTRTTAILAGTFFATSIALAILAGSHTKPRSLVDGVTTPPGAAAPAVPAAPAAPAAPTR